MYIFFVDIIVGIIVWINKLIYNLYDRCFMGIIWFKEDFVFFNLFKIVLVDGFYSVVWKFSCFIIFLWN